MMMMMMTMMVNVYDDNCYLFMKVISVKEVMYCDVSPVAMFGKNNSDIIYTLYLPCTFP